MKNKITVEGVEYIFQKVTPREWLKIRERSKNKYGNSSQELLYTEVFEHVIISPKVGIDDFEEIETLEEVITAAINFQCKRQRKEEQKLSRHGQKELANMETGDGGQD
ncbi:hypothetical protein Amet_4352 [Alkaliphilus metalliredigens QYMF]|uniref:Uncharacterized protein n=1 Tax=Alkaliphilus metalliredigens (strain QYMF) TaxID=293826 RepID=A6TKD9_ALKMQ|nr:hypothetical protein [Alkaliphilus metalliredigens]ABR46657.1 hypothetical protein Amet_0429 [Alkaliphilus metalliredigens QYMF]ABR48129.1 hypothetical protein Amet_1966 [Alkaliphilus metalliredigens QYMF]ABR50426.1 hypothetical protein Amet_4352 [Alkaliphilus metalliredigens QYMF]